MENNYSFRTLSDKESATLREEWSSLPQEDAFELAARNQIVSIVLGARQKDGILLAALSAGVYLIALFNENQYLSYFGFIDTPPPLSLLILSRSFTSLAIFVFIYFVTQVITSLVSNAESRSWLGFKLRGVSGGVPSIVASAFAFGYSSRSTLIVSLFTLVGFGLLSILPSVYNVSKYKISFREELMLDYFQWLHIRKSIWESKGKTSSANQVQSTDYRGILVGLLFAVCTIILPIVSSGFNEASRTRVFMIARREKAWFVARAYDAEIYLVRTDKLHHPREWKIVPRSEIGKFSLYRS